MSVKAEDPLVTLEIGQGDDGRTRAGPAARSSDLEGQGRRQGQRRQRDPDARAGGAAQPAACAGRTAIRRGLAPTPPHRAPVRRRARRSAAPWRAATAQIDGEAFKQRARVALGARCSRASSVSTSPRSKAPGRRTASCSEDVQSYVKQAMTGAAAPAPRRRRGRGDLNLLPWPQVDFAEVRPGRNRSRCRGSRRSPAPTCTATG